MEQIKERNSITDGVIWKALMAFFFPILLGTLFQQLYNTVDAIIVGRFVDAAALAAVGGSAGRILDLLVGFFVGLSSGATVIVSQHYGAKDDDGVSKAVHTAISLALFAGIFLTVVIWIVAPTVLRMMQTPEDVFDRAVEYLRVVSCAAVGNMLYNIGAGILRAVGDSKRPLYFLIAACLTNIVLDLIFVLFLKMGVVGVALATGISQLLSAVLVCMSLVHTQDSYQLILSHIRADADTLRRTLRIGLPAGLQSVMYSFSNIVITSGINTFGTATAASWVALGKVDGLFWMMNNAFGVSVTTFAGQNYGAHKNDRVKKGMRTCLCMELIATAIFMIVMFMLRNVVFGLFTTEQEVMRLSAYLLTCMLPWYWLFAPIETMGGTLRGMGNTMIPTCITATGICGLRMIWMFLVVPHWHEVFSITLSYPISWGITAIVFIFYYRYATKDQYNNVG